MARRSGKSDDVAGVIAPPPLIYLGFLLLGLGIGRVAPIPFHDTRASVPLRVGVGAAVAAAGLALGVAGFRQFRRAGTEVRPDRPTAALVTGGVYRRSRNPLYIALALVHAGIALAVDSLWALLSLVPALAVIRYGVIAREETYLERKFGEDYLRYKRAVQRWL